MGIIFSRFRKKKTSAQRLETLEKDIKTIEEHRIQTERWLRKLVGQLIILSVGTYVVLAAIFYFIYFPATLWDQLWYIIPLISFPFLMVLLHRTVHWYYHRRLLRDEEKLDYMKNEKKKILDEVMEKETYKVAKEILEKYAPEQIRKPVSLPTSPVATPQKNVANKSLPFNTQTEAELRRRAASQPLALPAASNNPAARVLVPTSAGPVVPTSVGPIVPSRQTNGQELARFTRLPMPRPVFPRERTYLDKFVEYILGDGPGNRYALICKQCESHNGMALQEEFEYIAFRCCYCYHFNPARKQRPHAPALPQPTKDTSTNYHTSSSELNSDSDTADNESENETPIESHHSTVTPAEETNTGDTNNTSNEGTEILSAKSEDTESIRSDTVESLSSDPIQSPSVNNQECSVADSQETAAMT